MCATLLVVVLSLGLLTPASPAAPNPPGEKRFNVTGEWSGEIVTPASYSPIPVYFKLSQKRKGITGTAGPSAGSQSPIQNVSREGNKLSFEVKSSDGMKFKFDLTVTEDKLEGDAHAEEPTGSKYDGKATLSRVK